MTHTPPNHIILTDMASSDRVATSRVRIATVPQLKAVLADFLDKEPRILELVSSGGNRLQIGIGGRFACAQFIKADNLPPYLCALTKDACATADAEFLMGMTPTPVPPEQCLTFDEVSKLTEHFLVTGERDLTVNWVEV